MTTRSKQPNDPEIFAADRELSELDSGAAEEMVVSIPPNLPQPLGSGTPG
jgi:hypothetical protein